MNTTNKLVNFWTCYFLETFNNGSYPTVIPNLKYICPAYVKYLTGSSPVEEHHGYIICILIYGLIYLVGTFGFVTNILNVFILQKSIRGVRSLKQLLIILAIVELFACVFVMANCVVSSVIQENVSHSWGTLQAFKITNFLYSLGRTAAIYTTILIAIERYLVVAFPIKSKSWLSPGKSHCYFGAVVVLTILLDVNWLFGTDIVENDTSLFPKDSRLSDFPYIFNSTTFATKVFLHPGVLYPLLTMNYVAPFPLLLIFNALLYITIYCWSKSRKKRRGQHRREINAAKMFSVVVLILLTCHSISCIIFFLTLVLGVVHRELYLLQLLSITLSASINFIVYYSFGKTFRVEFHRLVGSCMSSLGCKSSIEDRNMSSSQPETSCAIQMQELQDANDVNNHR